ncbi:MAG TPA: tetraacyldisaccharide 4'-kinase [Stellaceae bacterium]|nr:tetraacyldisaccharide 4'-kinase [Stellaceae bacterium]
MSNRSAPEFWAEDGLLPLALEPLACLVRAGARFRTALARPWRAPVPVICVGNLVAGGAGKTPVVLSLARHFLERGVRFATLSRGYGGCLRGPVRVDPRAHGADEVGDEPLLLAEIGPAIIARDRVQGAKLAIDEGAEILLLDDGFQNPGIIKDLSFIVIDGGYGFGNGRVLPAGPLREPIARGLARADAMILIGEDVHEIANQRGDLPLLRARLVPLAPQIFKGAKVAAFAGIGRPGKFFQTLTELGAELVTASPFPDHHRYREAELRQLRKSAGDAILVTTAKDAVRLPAPWRAEVRVLEITLSWEDTTQIETLLAQRLSHV